MPVITPQLSDTQQAIISRTLLGTKGLIPAAVARRITPPLTLAVPHHVFTARLDALGKGRPFEEVAEPIGLRVLVEENQQVTAAVELSEGSLSERPPQVFAQTNRGPFVRGTVAALQVAEADASVNEADFEFRLLRVPALNLVAVWLHGLSTPGIVVPVAPAPAPFEANRGYGEAEFSQTLHQVATDSFERLSSSDDPEAIGA